MKSYKNEQCGRSMIEMMGYIAVVITLMVSIGHLITNAFNDYKTSKASLQIGEFADVISKAGAIEEDYTLIVDMINGTGGASATQKAEGLKMIPSSFRVKGRKIFHAYGGEVKVGIPATEDVSGINDTYQNKFYITFYNLNRTQCIELAVKDWLSNKYSDLYAIIINGSSGAGWYWPAYTSGGGASGCSGNTCVLPVKRSAVAGTDATQDDGQCKDNNGNTIMWVFN